MQGRNRLLDALWGDPSQFVPAGPPGSSTPGTPAPTAGPAQPVLDIFPPWYVPGKDARDFFAQSLPLVALAANAQNVDLGIRFVVPAGMRAVISSISVFVQNCTTLWDGTFALLVDAQTVTGYNALSVFSQNANGISEDFPSMIHDINEGRVLTMTASENGGNAFTVGAAFTGWYWPAQGYETIWGPSKY